MDAARQLMCGDAELIIAGGVESMTRAPFVMAKAAERFQRTTEIYDTTLGWRFTNKKLSAIHHPYSRECGEAMEYFTA
jgi:acetyl-CoA acetyltransferase